MDALLDAISPDPGNSVRAWYVDAMAALPDPEARARRVRVVTGTFESLDAAHRELVVHWIRCFHMYHVLHCTPAALRIDTPFQAALAIAFATRDRCRLLRKNGIYRILQKTK
jgi:hypothetical protein